MRCSIYILEENDRMTKDTTRKTSAGVEYELSCEPCGHD